MSRDEEYNLTAREVRESYNAALRARREYRRAVGGPMDQMAHERLHESTLDYYETVRPLIKSSNVTDEHWSKRELWPVAPITTAIAVCPHCRSEGDVEYAGELCPRCQDLADGAPVLEKTEVQAVDEEGNPRYHYAEGLQTLDDLRLGVTTKTDEWTDALGKHERTSVEKNLLDPRKLLTVLDVLDEAMGELNLLAEIDDDAVETSLDQTHLEAFRDRLEELHSEAGIHDRVESEGTAVADGGESA